MTVLGKITWVKRDGKARRKASRLAFLLCEDFVVYLHT